MPSPSRPGWRLGLTPTNLVEYIEEQPPFLCYIVKAQSESVLEQFRPTVEASSVGDRVKMIEDKSLQVWEAQIEVVTREEFEKIEVSL